jgi:hypothetical protein
VRIFKKRLFFEKLPEAKKVLGEWLIQKKEEVGHGNWLKWCKENNINERTARRYINEATASAIENEEEQLKSDRLSDLPESSQEEDIDCFFDSSDKPRLRKKSDMSSTNKYTKKEVKNPLPINAYAVKGKSGFTHNINTYVSDEMYERLQAAKRKLEEEGYDGNVTLQNILTTFAMRYMDQEGL